MKTELSNHFIDLGLDDGGGPDEGSLHGQQNLGHLIVARLEARSCDVLLVNFITIN